LDEKCEPVQHAAASLISLSSCSNIQSTVEIEKVNVLGVGISVLDQNRTREFLFDALRTGKRGYVTVTGVHGVSEAQRDPALLDIFSRALLVTPDGMPMVWMGKLQGHKSIQRVYGPDLMLNLCEHSVGKGFSHFLFGSAPGVADNLKHILEARFHGLRIVGTYAPPFRRMNDTEVRDLQERIRICRPDFFWVGLSTPKQEFFMAEFMPILPETKILIGVGAAFDLLTGRVSQAPHWIQRSGLEWLFRLIQEPKRLWKRYLVNNPLFVVRAMKQLLCARK
jgi:N-acetylglucosaminyldiphosphoundecaprenol N-acetyl-beta-D-mannosaminyltransferase